MNPTTAFTLRQTHEGSQDGAAEATRQEHIHGIFRNTSNRSEETTGDIPTFINRGRYTSRGIDRHPPIPPSQVLLFQKQRPGRLTIRRTVDPVADQSFGDAIVYKAPNTTRVMFQNVKGLTSTQEGSDYRYFLSSMLSYSVDIFGMAETNLGWQHTHLRNAFKQCVQRQFQYGKQSSVRHLSRLILSMTGKPSTLGSPPTGSRRINDSGFGPPITDPTGLGRWSGFTLIGKDGQKFSIITGYRTCASSISSAPRKYIP
ncbi:hypothetical protein MHU86_6558 [Fragilaria crotonensis]|nr:hypothetical protein MHU86_6558 [Fragilaria crotonensis]